MYKDTKLKILKTGVILSLLFGFIECAPLRQSNAPKLEVKTFVDLLKSNAYDSLDLPEFTYRDIPELLKYRNEKQIISNFPHNPISSYYCPNCTLGMYVLWTIESIRAVSIQHAFLVKRFPSQNPVLKHRNPNKLILVSATDDASHLVAANAYNDWWEDNKGKDFNDFNAYCPLDGTDYQWH